MSGFGKRIADGMSWSLGKHGFILYPTSTNGYLSGLLDDGTTISARTNPVDYSELFLDGSVLVDGEGNPAKNATKSFFIAKLKNNNSNYEPLGSQRLSPLLSGNQFVYDGKDCYSYWGSSYGDLPIRLKDDNEMLLLSPYEVFGYIFDDGVGFFMFDTEGNLLAAPVNCIYKNGKLARVFDSNVVIGLGIFNSNDVKKIVISLSNGDVLICDTNLNTQFGIPTGLKRVEISNKYIYQNNPDKYYLADLYTKINFFNGHAVKFSSDGTLMSLITYTSTDPNALEPDIITIKTYQLLYYEEANYFNAVSISNTNYQITHTNTYSNTKGDLESDYVITYFSPLSYMNSLGFYYPDPHLVSTDDSDYASEEGGHTESGRFPIAINYVNNTLRIAFIEIDSTVNITGEKSSEITFSGTLVNSPNGFEAVFNPISGWERIPDTTGLWTSANGESNYSQTRSIVRSESIYIKCDLLGGFSAINIPIRTIYEIYDYSNQYIANVSSMTAEWVYVPLADAYQRNYLSYSYTTPLSNTARSDFDRSGIRKGHINYLDLKTNTYCYNEVTAFSEVGFTTQITTFTSPITIVDGEKSSTRSTYEKNIKAILPDQTTHTVANRSISALEDFDPTEIPSIEYGLYYKLYWQSRYNYIQNIANYYYWQQSIGGFCCPIDLRNNNIRYICSYDIVLDDIFSVDDEPNVAFERHYTISSLTDFNSSVSTYLNTLTNSVLWNNESTYSLFPIGVC